MHIDERPLTWVYSACALAGLAVAFLLPSAKARVPIVDRRAYFRLQIITLCGAVIGAKLVMLMGDLGWPREHIEPSQVIFSGKSLVGGLLGGFISAEIAKPFFNYHQPPNDWFATKLLLSVAIGRIGCVFAGCCRGLPHDGAFTLTYSDGIARYPSAIYELAFHLALFVVFVISERRRIAVGRLFALYLVVYGLFRFATEPLRETPKLVAGASVYQVWCVVLVIAGSWSLYRQQRRMRATITTPRTEET